MSSGLTESEVEVLETVQFLAYTYIAAASVVSYDSILSFSRELELIWMKPWSVLSTLFVAARYIGLAVAIMTGFGTGFGVFNMSKLVCTVVPEIIQWTRLVYIVVADVIMILRVSVMFNQPKRTRRILLFLYFLVTVNTIVFMLIWDGPGSGYTAVPMPLISGTLCYITISRNQFDYIYDGIPRGLFDILLLALAVYRFSVHVAETRRMMGRQNVNKYMTLLLEHSILYFVLNFTIEALAAGNDAKSAPLLYSEISSIFISSIPFLIYPRLVLDMKDYRATEGALQIGSEGSGYPRSYGHAKSPSVPVTESEEYDMLEGTSLRTSQHTRA